MIKKYQDSNGQWLFMVSYFTRGPTNPYIKHRRQKSGIKSLEQARKEEIRLIKKVKDEIVVKENEGQKLRVVIERWFKHTMATKVACGEIGAKYAMDYRGTLLDWLKPYSTLPASLLTSYMVQEIVRKKQTDGVGLSQVRHFRRAIRGLYEFAITYRWVPKGTKIPTPVIKSRSKTDVEPEVLNTDEIKLLVSEAFERQNPWRYVWAMALLTGMRSGELKALLWSDVDLENRIVRVSKSIESRTQIVKSTKAGYWRDVPISHELKKLLDELKTLTGQMNYVLERPSEWNANRQALHLRKFCKEIGISSIRFHTLRACFATQLLRQGVEPAKVMKVCGWKDLSTMQRYVRLSGIEVHGITDGLKIFPEGNPGKKVVDIRGFRK